MFSIMTIASSTTKPVEIVKAIRERLLRLYPSRYITPNVPTNDNGTAILGMIVADESAQEEKDHHDHQRHRQHQLKLHVFDRGPNGDGSVSQDRDLTEEGKRAP